MHKQLTQREHEILKILWSVNKGLTARQISNLGNNLSISTTQATLKNLLEYEYIRVEEIIMTGKALSRTYAPTIAQEDYILNEYDDINLNRFINAFLGQSEIPNEEINQVKKLLDDYQKTNFN